MRSIGVASAAAALALGVAGTSYACNISDFTLSNTVSCDKDSGNGTLAIHDTDGVRPVMLVVKDDRGTEVTTADWTSRDKDYTLTVPWKQGTHYTVYASVTHYFLDNAVGQGVTIPNEVCGTPATSSSPTASATPSATATTPSDTAPTTGAPTTGAPTTSAPAAVVDDTNAPKPAGGTSNLAETGGGSNTGMIAGVAAALVVAGGGTVFMLRRRKPSAHS